MGEIADDMVDGSACCLCGALFIEDHDEHGTPLKDKDGNVRGFSHGYPAVCKECWEDLSKRQRRQYKQKSLKPTL